jgi:hypothetical protein
LKILFDISYICLLHVSIFLILLIIVVFVIVVVVVWTIKEHKVDDCLNDIKINSLTSFNKLNTSYIGGFLYN